MSDQIRLLQTLSRGADLKKAAALAVNVYARVINESSATIEYAEFALSDDSGSGDAIVKTIRLESIAPGATKTGYASFPTGIEKVLYKFKVEGDPELYSGGGLGNNAPGVEVTITD